MKHLVQSVKSKVKPVVKALLYRWRRASHDWTKPRIEIQRNPVLARTLEKNNYLAAYAQNIASQGGEDGVIAKIFDIIGITEPGWCVEFGACDGKTDSNTWHLVHNKGWKAVYIEPEPTFFPLLKAHCDQTPNTYCFDDMVGWDGPSKLDTILARTPIPKDLEFMVIDIDGNDYYVWEALSDYKPKVVCIEFHRLTNAGIAFVGEKGSSLSCPASVTALTNLAKSKGYELVCTINWNLFFVRKEYFSKFNISDNRPESMHYAEGEMRLLQGYDGTLYAHNFCIHFWKMIFDQQGGITNVPITHNDIQVLPEGLRAFRPRHLYRSKTLEAQAGKLDASRLPANTLLAKRQNIYSECGEDGILNHIFSVITLPETMRYCVDIGACDGTKWSNTRHRIADHGWKGLMIEKDTDQYATLASLYSGNTNVVCAQEEVRSKNVATILKRHNVPATFGLLSIDVEGNDYHLWKALRHYQPAVVVIDFNPSVSNDMYFTQANDVLAHAGASLLSLKELAATKGYVLVAATDWNAIFVHKNYAPALGIDSSDLKSFYYPPFEMHVIQTLDGCMHLHGCQTLVRQDYPIEWEDFQVLPKQLRGRDNSAENFGKMRSVFYETEEKIPDNQKNQAILYNKQVA
jgi:hypothetical protein